MPSNSPTRVRLRFAKRGDLRLVSHHDLMRCLERSLRRADLPVVHTQGFNPRPRAVFPLAMALGIEGRREVLELDLSEPLPPTEVLERLAAVSPPGFDFLEAECVASGRAARVVAARYALDLPSDQREAVRRAVSEFLASTRWPFTRVRPDRTVEVDLRPFVLDLELDATDTLRFRLKVTPEGSARPEEVVAALGLRGRLEHGGVLVRTEVELHNELPGPDRTPATASVAPVAPAPVPTGQPPESSTA